MGAKIKIFFRYVLPSRTLEFITKIYYISLLAKHLIMYWWKTWADCYWDNMIMTTAKDVSVNIVCMTVPVKWYWKTILEDASYMGHKVPSSQRLTTRRGMKMLSLQKQITNYIYLLSFAWILKALHVNKTRASHRHQNPSLPNTNNTYHLEDASMLNVVMGNTLNYLKWI